MTGLSGILFLCFLASANSVTYPTVFPPGYLYQYGYQSRFLSGIPTLAPQYTGIELLGDLIIQSVPSKLSPEYEELLIKLDNIKVAKLQHLYIPDPYHADVPKDFSYTTEYQKFLSKPVRVFIKEGKIISFEVDSSESTWVLNIKKGILSLLQVNLGKQLSQRIRPNTVETEDILPEVFAVYEDSIGGNCETWYTIDSNPNPELPMMHPVLNISKVRNYKNCIKRPVFGHNNHAIRGCPWLCSHVDPKMAVPGMEPLKTSIPCECPAGYDIDDDIVKSFVSTKYNISGTANNLVIESILSEGKSVFNVYGDELIIFAHQNVTLRSVVPTQEIFAEIYRPIKHTSLVFELPKSQETIHNVIPEPEPYKPTFPQRFMEKTYPYPERKYTQSPVFHHEFDPFSNFKRPYDFQKKAYHEEQLKTYPENYLPTQENYDIPYLSVFSPVSPTEMKNMVRNILESLTVDIIRADLSVSEVVSYKVIKLVRALSVLKVTDLHELIRDVIPTQQRYKVSEREQVMRKLLLDALPLSGTNDAVVIIKYLIEKELVLDFEARELVEGLPKNIVYPREETIHLLYELMQLQKVKSNRLLLGSTSLAFARLVRDVCVIPHLNYARHETREEYLYKPQTQDDLILSLCHPEVVEKYVKKISELLDSTQEFHKKAIYIETLANIGHPVVLQYLKPYIFGQTPKCFNLQDERSPTAGCNFLRQLTIYTMHHLVVREPELILPLVTPIFFNTAEPYEIRIAAFTVILYSNPPLPILNRIVTRLWLEKNKQVANVVYTSLKSLSNTTIPCYQNLAQKIRQVMGELKPVDFGTSYSFLKMAEFNDIPRDYSFHVLYEWVHSNVSIIPRAGYLGAMQNIGPFWDLPVNFGFVFKGWDQILDRLVTHSDILSELSTILFGPRKYGVERLQQEFDEIKTKLNLVFREPEDLKASVFFQLFERTSIYTLDKEYISEMLQHAIKFYRQLEDQVRAGIPWHYVKVILPSSSFKVLPSETGLPVVISNQKPTIMSLRIRNIYVQLPSSGYYSGDVNFALEIQPTIHYSSHVFGGIVDPVAQTMYGSTMVRRYHMTLPLNISLQVDVTKHVFQLNIQPQLTKIFYHKSDAATFIRKNYLSQPPEEHFLGQYLPIRTLPIPLKYDEVYGRQLFGLGLHVKGIAETIWSDIPLHLSRTTQEKGYLAGILEVISNPGKKYREFVVSLEPDHQTPIYEYNIKFQYKRMLEKDEPQLYRKERNTGILQKAYEYLNLPFTRVYKPYHSDVFSGPKTYLPRTTSEYSGSNVIDTTVTHVWSIVLEGKGPVPITNVLDLFYTRTLDFRTIWTKIHLLTSTTGQYRSNPVEMCFNSVVKFPPKPNVFLLDTVLTNDQKVDINADISWGSECLTSQERHVSINAIVEKSNEQKNVHYEPRKLPRMTTLYNTNYIAGLSGQWSLPWYYKQCQIDQQQGKSQSYACKLAIMDDSYLNKITMEINYEKVPPYLVNLTHHIDLALKAYLYPLVDNNAVDVRNSEKQIRIIAEFVKQVPGVPLLNLFIEKPTENTYIRKIYLPYVKPLSLLVPPVEDHMRLLWNSKVEPVCSMMERYIETLDNVTFPTPETQCQYLLSKDCSPEERYAVILTPTEATGHTKALLVHIVGHEIKLLPSWQQSSIEIIIDQQTHQLVYGQPLQVGSVESPIYVYLEETLSRPIVVVQAEVEGLHIRYDGVNARIKVSPKYMGKHCGLCGDFNGESYREFLGPNLCVYTNSQDFVNSYVLGGQQCQLPSQPLHPFVCPSTYSKSLYQYTKPLGYLRDRLASPVLQTQPIVRKYTPYTSLFQTPSTIGVQRPIDDRQRLVSPLLQTQPIARKYTPYTSWFQTPSTTGIQRPIDERERLVSPLLQTQPMVRKYTPYSPWFQTFTTTGVQRSIDERERLVSPLLQTPHTVRKYTPYSSLFQTPNTIDVYSPVEEDRCILKKVWTKHWDNNICFSKEFVPICKDECIPSHEIQDITLNFFCLPENSPYLQDLFEKAKTGRIEEIQLNTKHHLDKVEVPKFCRPVYQ